MGKDFEIGYCLECLRNSKETSMVCVEWAREYYRRRVLSVDIGKVYWF